MSPRAEATAREDAVAVVLPLLLLPLPSQGSIGDLPVVVAIACITTHVESDSSAFVALFIGTRFWPPRYFGLFA